MRSAKRSKRDVDEGRADGENVRQFDNHNKLRNLLLAIKAFDHDAEGNQDGTNPILATLSIQDMKDMRSQMGYVDGLLSHTLSKLEKEEENNHHAQQQPPRQLNDMFPPEVVRHVSQSGYLDAVDLGRFVLFTKKTFLYDLTPNLFYKEVFKTRYRYLMHSNNTEKELDRFVVAYMERSDGSYKRALQNFEKHPKCKKGDPKPPEPMAR